MPPWCGFTPHPVPPRIHTPGALGASRVNFHQPGNNPAQGQHRLGSRRKKTKHYGVSMNTFPVIDGEFHSLLLILLLLLILASV